VFPNQPGRAGTGDLRHSVLVAELRVLDLGHKWMTLMAKYSVISSSGKSVLLDVLSEHDVPIAFVAGKRGGSVGMYNELPDLKFIGGDSVVISRLPMTLRLKRGCSCCLSRPPQK
jgi:hypothetical protein